MLLIIEALLLILVALGQDHRAAVAEQIFPLDMAPNSVDDQYEGCTKEMANLVKKKYLMKEQNKSHNFKNAWQDGENKVATPSPGDTLTMIHLIAIYVYTDYRVYEGFNTAVRNDKQKYKIEAFEWYSLHFLLTEAIQILNKTQNKCHDTFRATNVKLNKDVLNNEVRFGSFASSSLDCKKVKHFGTVSCFEIHTCEGAELTEYSKLPREKEVLIPPYEKFKVTAVRTRRDKPDLWCETVYTLTSTGRQNSLNCEVATPTKKPTMTLKNTSKCMLSHLNLLELHEYMSYISYTIIIYLLNYT